MQRSTLNLFLAALVVVGTAASAQSVPGRIQFSARLVDQGVPVTGVQAVQFALFDVPTGGVATWSETHALTFTSDGLGTVELGSASALDSTKLDGRQLFLEVTVGATVLAPRLSVVSAPYAIRAHTAWEAGRLGTLTPGDVQQRVTGTCSSGQAIRAVDATGTVSCESVGGASYTGTAPVTVASNAISLSTCGPEQVLKMNLAGSGWVCAADGFGTLNPADLVTSVTGGGGVVAARMGNAVSLGLDSTLVQARVGSSCGPNAAIASISATGTVTCEPDDNTTVSATAPLALTGSALSLTACPANQLYQMNAAGSAWACASPPSYVNGSGLTLVGSTFATDNTVVARKDSVAGNQAFDTSTLYLDYANNRVGVNTATPGTTLDVAGIARATDFQLSAPRTGYLLVAGSTFVAAPGGDEVWDVDPINGTANISTTGTAPYDRYVGAWVNLPDGVTITGFSCYVFDQVSTNLMGVMYLRRRTLSLGSWTNLGTLDYSTTGTPGMVVTSSAAISSVVDNTLYGYSLSSTMSATNVTSPTFYGCRITYTSPR